MIGREYQRERSTWAEGGTRADRCNIHPDAVAKGGPPVPLLEIDRVTLQYKTMDCVVTATQQVSFIVYPADRFILLGPSGCGKSTLLKAIAGFLPPVSGEIRLHSKAVEQPGPDRMMVFQEFDQLLPWKTVRQNVEFALKTSGCLRGAEAAGRAAHYIEKVGLLPFIDSYPHTLSGGMKQRVSIARGMAMEPDVLLMDEPFAALDALTRRKMQDELLQLWDDTRFTLLFVTHSIEEAVRLGTRILLLSRHPGQVKAELNGLATSDIDTSRQSELMARINSLLFAG